MPGWFCWVFPPLLHFQRMKGVKFMDPVASVVTINESHFFLEIYLDPFNKRIRVDDYRGNLNLLLEKAEEVALKHMLKSSLLKGALKTFFHS